MELIIQYGRSNPKLSCLGCRHEAVGKWIENLSGLMSKSCIIPISNNKPLCISSSLTYRSVPPSYTDRPIFQLELELQLQSWKCLSYCYSVYSSWPAWFKHLLRVLIMNSALFLTHGYFPFFFFWLTHAYALKLHWFVIFSPNICYIHLCLHISFACLI